MFHFFVQRVVYIINIVYKMGCFPKITNISVKALGYYDDEYKEDVDIQSYVPTSKQIYDSTVITSKKTITKLNIK